MVDAKAPHLVVSAFRMGVTIHGASVRWPFAFLRCEFPTMKYPLVALTLFLFPALSQAAGIVWWTLPTMNTDGSAIRAGTTLTVNVLQGKAGGPFVQVASGVAGTQYTVASLAAGSCFELETVAAGAETGISAPSVQACASTIGAPSGVGAAVSSIGTTVYMEVRGSNRFSLVAVGTVPIGTRCDPTQDVDGYDVVPVTAVKWAGNVRPPVVVAKCG